MRTRVNDVLGPSSLVCGVLETRNNSSGVSTFTSLVYNPASYYKWKSFERTTDELHPGPPYVTGGPFDNWKGFNGGYALSPLYVIQRTLGNPGLTYTYRGSFLQIPPSVFWNFDVYRDPSNSGWNSNGITDISPYGPTGWKMYQPLKPTIDLGQDLYEIREIPKMLRQTASLVKSALDGVLRGNIRKFTPKSAGSQWLNLNFGWVPVVSSLVKLSKYQEKCWKQYHYLKKNNGLWRKRGGMVYNYRNSSLVSSTGYPTSGVYPKPTTGIYAPDYATRIWNKLYLDETKEVWFEGSFRYLIPDLGDFEPWSKDYVSRLGLSPSPSLVWKLTPWSWLIDWFTNFGDIIENLQNEVSNQVVARYAYVMGHTRKEYRYETLFPFYGQDVILNRRYSLERKQRVGASPFGFGLTMGELTPWQWSILGALGISKTH